MCTVVVFVPPAGGGSVRLLAVRDEDPARPWHRLGAWWDDRPGVLGVRDDRAGGAWLAADPSSGRLAVILNREEAVPVPDPQTRGALTLEAVAGRSPEGNPGTRGFNLVEASSRGVRVISWDGVRLTRADLAPGTHMIGHDDLDDPRTPRIVRWLPEFGATPPPDSPQWWDEWVAILARSAGVAPVDAPEAIIRRGEFQGNPSESLLVCVARLSDAGLELHDSPLATPGVWQPPQFRRAQDGSPVGPSGGLRSRPDAL